MASDMQAFVLETVIARINGVGRGDAFGHESQSLRSLERGARRILTHYRTVEKRTPRVARQEVVVLSAFAPNHAARVVSRRRYHAEHLAS